MSVYTVLSFAQIQAFALPFGLDVVSVTPIQSGIENTNYFLTTHDEQQYVLTVFEQLQADEVSEIFPVLQHLQQQGLPVAVPLATPEAMIDFIAGKPAQIAPRLKGEHPMMPNLAQVTAMATALAQLHIALDDFPLNRHSQNNLLPNPATLAEHYPCLTTEDVQLLNDLFSRLKHYQSRYPNRPCGLIHGDVFRDNVLFDGDGLSGILDFSELTHQEWLLDIAITINDFCSEPLSDRRFHIDLNPSKYQAFVAAYQAVRPMTEDEKSCLAIYLALAASCFWLLRVEVAERNRLEGRSSAHILQKNPTEMRNMLLKRLDDVASFHA